MVELLDGGDGLSDAGVASWPVLHLYGVESPVMPERHADLVVGVIAPGADNSYQPFFPTESPPLKCLRGDGCGAVFNVGVEEVDELLGGFL